MKTPFFTIVIPVYNRSGILADRLTYLLNQKFQDYEVLIIDDGSKDNPEIKLRPIIDKNPFIKIIRQENAERGAARNKGILNAGGKYIILFDSDDFMHENHLQSLHKGILDNDFPDFITTKFNFQNEDGKLFDSEIAKLSSGKYNYKLFLSGNPLACNICFKREIPNLILFEEDRSYSIKEDWMFLISNLKNHELIILDELTISMYDHIDRSMKSNNAVIISRTKNAVNWIKNHLALSISEIHQINAHENYFCGIHAYLDGKRSSSISYALKAISNGGIKLNYISLLIKSIIGRSLILKFK